MRQRQASGGMRPGGACALSHLSACAPVPRARSLLAPTSRDSRGISVSAAVAAFYGGLHESMRAEGDAQLELHKGRRATTLVRSTVSAAVILATRSLHYLGPRPANPQSAWKGTFAAPVVDVVAEATYSSPDPSCTKSIEYRPAGNRIVQVFVQLQPPRGALRRVSAGVGRIPLGEPHPGQDGAIDPYGRPKCGKPDFGDWYQDAVAYAPARLLAKPRVTITTHHEEKFSDPGIESLEWILKVVLQRVGYRKINCATHPGC